MRLGASFIHEPPADSPAPVRLVNPEILDAQHPARAQPRHRWRRGLYQHGVAHEPVSHDGDQVGGKGKNGVEIDLGRRPDFHSRGR